MYNDDKSVGEVIEDLIYIKDHLDNRSNKESVELACNMLEYTFTNGTTLRDIIDHKKGIYK